MAAILGSPLSFGVVMGQGREYGGLNGRLVTMGHIGDPDAYRSDYGGSFWFGVVSRAHPSSDKIARNRIELLMFVLWGEWTFVVQESRLMLRRRGHHERAKLYRGVIGPYLTKPARGS